MSESGAVLTTLGAAAFDSTAGEKRLCALFKVGSLDAFGAFERAEIAAMSAVAEYLEITQRGNLPLLRPPVRETQKSAMQIDAATRRSLELTHALAGGRQGSLLACIDRTVTAGGARLLERRLASPSCDLAIITARQDAVAFMLDQTRQCDDIRDALRGTHDLDRALSRLALDRGGPRDMAAIRNTMAQAARLPVHPDMPPLLADVARDLAGHDDLLALLDAALVAEPPLLARDGGFIAAGYDDGTRRCA